MMNVCVFAGTTEGRELIQYYENKDINITVCVATEYGQDILQSIAVTKNINIHSGRMNLDQMKDFFRNNSFDKIIDATHPYAQAVTLNIKRACEDMQINYIRLNRKESEKVSGKYYNSSSDVADYLSYTSGNILLTTGSKELASFTGIPDYRNRIYPRVLPLDTSLEACREHGFELSHIIAMQGPFSKELNKALINSYDIKYLVTKESGAYGGFIEKAEAAEECGIECLIIGRPDNKGGYTYEEVLEHIDSDMLNSKRINSNDSTQDKNVRCMSENEYMYSAQPLINSGREASNIADSKCCLEKADCIKEEAIIESQYYNKTDIKKITIIGIGTGSINQMTQEAINTINESDILIGAKRILSSCTCFKKKKYCAFFPEEILAFLNNHAAYKNVSILMSGDVGFYSGAKNLVKVFSGLNSRSDKNHYDVNVICGISSPVYLSSRLGMPWESMKLCSVHGRQTNIISYVKRNFRTFALVGGELDASSLCRLLCEYGLGYVKVYIGERLSYEDERITVSTAEALCDVQFDTLASVIIENERFSTVVPIGIDDEGFIRKEKIPMTKSEVRCVSVAKLGLSRDSIVYDIGAGSGSVSIEMALQAYDGTVYAIEKKHEAVELIKENKLHFALPNIEVIEGTAPGALYGLSSDCQKKLPVPTHAFIGGSSGNLQEIIEILLENNKNMRVVINAITLETLSEALECIKRLNIVKYEIVNITVAKSKKLAGYSMMTGQNPVYIITIN